MARDVYHMTVSLPVTEPDLGVTLLRPLSGIKVSVYARGTTNLVTIYQRPTGVTEGPTPESGATGGPNPFVTAATGDVEFWADGPAELDVYIEDTQGPARISARTYGWNCLPAKSLPGTILDPTSATITQSMMAPSVVNQWTQIGQVIDWWRPNASVPLPSGFEICDGHSVPAGQHEFVGVAGAINVPDLRNRFILGALPTNTGEAGGLPVKAHGQGADQGNNPTDGPGLAGTGGTNAAKDVTHKHTVPVPNHVHPVPAHAHSAGTLYTGNHSHGVSVSGTTGATGYASVARTPADSGTVAPYSHTHPFSGSGGTDTAGNLGIGGSTANSGVFNTDNPTSPISALSDAAAWTTDPGTDFRPRFYGLLKLIKVRRS